MACVGCQISIPVIQLPKSTLPEETSTEDLLKMGCFPPSFLTKPKRVLTFPTPAISPPHPPHTYTHTSPHSQAAGPTQKLSPGPLTALTRM